MEISLELGKQSFSHNPQDLLLLAITTINLVEADR